MATYGEQYFLISLESFPYSRQIRNLTNGTRNRNIKRMKTGKYVRRQRKKNKMKVFQRWRDD
jgi:hypothetical protein